MSYLHNRSRYFNSVKSIGFLTSIPTFWHHLQVSIFLIKRATAVSVIFGNDVIAAAILNKLKLVFFLNDGFDINYYQFKFQVNPCIIHKVVFVAKSMICDNDVTVATILNIQKSV